MDLSLFTEEKFKTWALGQSAEDFCKHLENMSSEQIKIGLLAMRENPTENSTNKLSQIISEIKQLPQLEAAGMTLTVEHILGLLEKSQHWAIQEQHRKLPSLFVGLPYPVFSDMLLKLSPSQLAILKHESVTEPVQHHLTYLIHEIHSQLNAYDIFLSQLTEKIELLKDSGIFQKETQQLAKEFSLLAQNYLLFAKKISCALAIAWNTNRPDLIQKLSDLKEHCQKTYQRMSLESQSTKPNLTETNNIYGDPTNGKDFEALKNDEPAIEGLAKFSIWYVQDYWEVGLLPSITNREDLEAKLENEQEQAAFRERLLAEVNSNLKKLGLETVQDLKNWQIYSKKDLVKFINSNKITD